MAKVKNTEAKRPLIALAIVVGYAKTIQINLGNMMAAEPPASFAKIRGVIRIRILFFYLSTQVQPGRRKRRSEKLNYRVGQIYLAKATVNFRRVTWIWPLFRHLQFWVDLQ
jgi:hypothetical protein